MEGKTLDEIDRMGKMVYDVMVDGQQLLFNHISWSWSPLNDSRKIKINVFVEHLSHNANYDNYNL
jgi:hypothetical protein